MPRRTRSLAGGGQAPPRGFSRAPAQQLRDGRGRDRGAFGDGIAKARLPGARWTTTAAMAMRRSSRPRSRGPVPLERKGGRHRRRAHRLGGRAGRDGRAGAGRHSGTASLPPPNRWCSSRTALSPRCAGCADRVRAVGQYPPDQLLRGEATFKVAKDKARPFVVQSGDVYAQATGTVYSVRRVGLTGGTVKVREGSVLVWPHDERDQAVLLHAGGTVTLDPTRTRRPRTDGLNRAAPAAAGTGADLAR